jgi:putative flippase GtrA
MSGLRRQALRFAGVGAVNTAIGFGVICAAMAWLHASPALANVLGYAIGLTISFMLNRNWTFGSRQKFRRQLPKYLLVTAVCYLVNLKLVMTAISTFSANPYWAQLMGVFFYSGSTFVCYRWFVFPTQVVTWKSVSAPAEKEIIDRSGKCL